MSGTKKWDWEKEVGEVFGTLGMCVGDSEGSDRQKRDPRSRHVTIS